MSTVGNINIEAGVDHWGNDYAVCNKYTTPSDITDPISISIYLDGTLTGDSVKLAIWKTSDWSLVSNSVSDPLTDVGSNWYTHTYTTSPVLTASTEYCLGLIGGGANWKYRRTQAGGKLDGFYELDSYTTPSSLSAPANAGAYEASLYLTYQVEATSTTATSTEFSITNIGEITFGLAIIIVLLSLIFISYLYNKITIKKPWK